MISKKILVMGLPGSGKTTLSKAIVPRLNAIHLNADDIRANIHKDLGFSHGDRIEHAQRLGWLSDKIAQSGNYVIADFVCPTAETRAAFGDAYIVWIDRIKEGRFEDTNRLFSPPKTYDIRVPAAGTPDYWAERISRALLPIFDPKKPTALLVGCFQPFHDGHKALIAEAIARAGQVCVAVRDTAGIIPDNPFPFDYIRARIEAALAEYAGCYTVVQLPNITKIVHGRDVGYSIERIDLEQGLESISATSIRRRTAHAGGLN